MTDERPKMTVSRIQSFDEAQRADREFWLALTPLERLEQVDRLTDELWRLKGATSDELRLSRSVTSIHRR
jgi:hypothetical protein